MKTNTLRIPTEILASANLIDCDEINISATDNMIIITKSNKTAKDLLSIVNALSEKSSDLVVNLALASDTCVDCFECVNADLDEEVFDCVPEIVFNTFLESNVCLGNLYSLIQSEDIIDEKY
ncbi:MAG: hypothetical protein R3Y09_14125 [Clostridia bacterium]